MSSAKDSGAVQGASSAEEVPAICVEERREDPARCPARGQAGGEGEASRRFEGELDAVQGVAAGNLEHLRRRPIAVALGRQLPAAPRDRGEVEVAAGVGLHALRRVALLHVASAVDPLEQHLGAVQRAAVAGVAHRTAETR